MVLVEMETENNQCTSPPLIRPKEKKYDMIPHKLELLYRKAFFDAFHILDELNNCIIG